MNRRDFLNNTIYVSLAVLMGIGLPGLRAVTLSESASGNGGSASYPAEDSEERHTGKFSSRPTAARPGS